VLLAAPGSRLPTPGTTDDDPATVLENITDLVLATGGKKPDELISNVHVVCRTTGGIVVCGNDIGWRFLPGGTREPGHHEFRSRSPRRLTSRDDLISVWIP